ncbi:hypothetical protein [Burkholderia diffusa]|uniref:hypothetical protein n=1 Tax=Burkholderia diffusa TaxID=488732 RepID=UPI001428CCBD|nr:hypothetical protein [Burkholderia diffusa]
MAQQLIVGIGVLGSSAFHASRSSRWSQYFLCHALPRRGISRDRITAEFLLRSHRACDIRTRRRCHIISLVSHFFGQEIPLPKTDLTTVIVRRCDARFSHDEASFYAGFCRV